MNQRTGKEKKIWTWRDRIDKKPGKNGGKLEPLTKVLEYRVGRKKWGTEDKSKKDKKNTPDFYSGVLKQV